MDDLDHSMRIAEEDWSNFCQETEECCVPQPLLACPEGLRCSDRSVPATQSSQSLEENRTTCVKLELIQDVVEEDTAEDNKAQICNDTGIPLFSQEVPVTEERIPEETQKSIVQTPEVNDVARSLPTECDTKVRCLAQSGSEFPLREKERWFVTLSLNDSPVSRRASATPREKKAPLKKKWCRPRREPQHNESAVNKNINATPNQNRSKERVGQKTSCGLVQNVCMETRHDGDIERNNRQRPEDITQDREDGTIQDIQQNRQERTLHVDIVQNKKEETLYDGDRTTHQDDSMRQDKIEATLNGDERTQTKSKRTFCVDHTTWQDNVEESPQGDDMVQNNNEGALHDDDVLQNDIEGTPHDIFPLERVDSDEFVDSVEFFTLPSSGSELYLSASESVAQDLFEEDSVENQPREFPSYSSLSLPHNCDPIQSSGVRSLQARESDDNGGGSDKAFVEPTWAFPPLMGQRGATAPDESSTQQKADLPRVQTEPHPTACGVDGPRSVPDVIVTPVADGPEAYAQATGRAPCVYAISDFWDEMEKLTINDILQLRMTRSPPSTETSDVPSQSGSLVDPDELHLTDGGLTDVSDAADSDYFTQPDDSKVDRSSWDFSVCDFEDDYWQFLGMSRNPSPDLSCKTQREEEEEEGATGIQTPVPVEDSPRQNPMPRAMMKNKSVQNIRALNTEDLSLQSHLHNDDEKSKKDSLGPVVAAPLQGDDLEFFPESFTTEGTGNRNVIFVYDPEGTSHAPGYNDMICTCEHKMFFPTQSHKWKPIPNFSCSHPTIRELPLLKRNDPFLSVDFLEEDVISPVRIISRALRVAEYQSGRSLLPFGKIRFQDKGSIWYRRSDGWELPTQSEEGGVAVPTVGGVSLQALEQQRIVGTMQRPVRVGVLSALQQSDMCLVCIAFASWVLASSDPESADAWKAAVLANVSALSAIQYLRQTK